MLEIKPKEIKKIIGEILPITDEMSILLTSIFYSNNLRISDIARTALKKDFIKYTNSEGARVCIYRMLNKVDMNILQNILLSLVEPDIKKIQKGKR